MDRLIQHVVYAALQHDRLIAKRENNAKGEGDDLTGKLRCFRSKKLQTEIIRINHIIGRKKQESCLGRFNLTEAKCKSSYSSCLLLFVVFVAARVR